MVQWLKLHPFNTGGAGSTPGQEIDTTCCMAKEKKKRKKKINYIDIFLPVLHHIIFQDLLVSSKEGCVFSRNTPKRPSFRVKLRSEFKSQSYQILALDFEPVISIPLVFIF